MFEITSLILSTRKSNHGHRNHFSNFIAPEVGLLWEAKFPQGCTNAQYVVRIHDAVEILNGMHPIDPRILEICIGHTISGAYCSLFLPALNQFNHPPCLRSNGNSLTEPRFHTSKLETGLYCHSSYASYYKIYKYCVIMMFLFPEIIAARNCCMKINK